MRKFHSQLVIVTWEVTSHSGNLGTWMLELPIAKPLIRPVAPVPKSQRTPWAQNNPDEHDNEHVQGNRVFENVGP